MEFAVGPVAIALAAVIGRYAGAWLGSAMGIGLGVAASLAMGVAVQRKLQGFGLGVAFVAALTGGANAWYGHTLAQLASGEHLVGAHLRDVARWRGHDRVSFADGELRGDLYGMAVTVNDAGTGSTHTRVTVTCTVAPILASTWTPGEPVRVWGIDLVSGGPWTDKTFHEEPPSETCKKALDRARVARHLADAADPIYLTETQESADPDAIRVYGLAVSAFAICVWLLGCAWIRAREWLAARRARRR